jgi:hypothetical protein
LWEKRRERVPEEDILMYFHAKIRTLPANQIFTKMHRFYKETYGHQKLIFYTLEYLISFLCFLVLVLKATNAVKDPIIE